MTALFTNGAEAGTATTAVSAANSGNGTTETNFSVVTTGTGNTNTFVSTWTFNGSLGYQMVGGGTAACLDFFTWTTATNWLGVRLGFQVSSVTAQNTLFKAFTDAAYVTQGLVVGVSTTGKITLQEGTHTLVSSTGGIATGTKYMMIVSFNQTLSTPTATVTVWVKGSGTVTATVTTTLVDAASLNSIRFGINTTAWANTLNFDDIGVTAGADIARTDITDAAPVISAVTANVYAPAGSLTLSGTITDSDGTVKTAVWSRVSGPDSSSLTTTTTGLNTASCTASCNTSVSAGVSVFQLDATDNLDVAATPVTCTVWAYPPSNANVMVRSVVSGTYSNVGGAADLVAALNDGLATTWGETGSAPVAEVETVQMNPFGPGNIILTPSGYQAPTTPAFTTVQFTVYKEDGTTQVDQQSAPTPIPTADAPLFPTPGMQLGTTPMGLIPAQSDRRALRVKCSATQ